MDEIIINDLINILKLFEENSLTNLSRHIYKQCSSSDSLRVNYSTLHPQRQFDRTVNSAPQTRFKGPQNEDNVQTHFVHVIRS